MSDITFVIVATIGTLLFSALTCLTTFLQYRLQVASIPKGETEYKLRRVVEDNLRLTNAFEEFKREITKRFENIHKTEIN